LVQVIVNAFTVPVYSGKMRFVKVFFIGTRGGLLQSTITGPRISCGIRRWMY